MLVIFFTSCHGVSVAASSAMLLQCLVRPDGPDGGTLLQHCTTNRTRTRTVQPPVKLSPTLAQPRSRTQRRPHPQSSDSAQSAPAHRRRRQHARHRHLSNADEEEQGQEEEEQEEEVDTGDPTWAPPKGGTDQLLIRGIDGRGRM